MVIRVKKILTMIGMVLTVTASTIKNDIPYPVRDGYAPGRYLVIRDPGVREMPREPQVAASAAACTG